MQTSRNVLVSLQITTVQHKWEPYSQISPNTREEIQVRAANSFGCLQRISSNHVKIAVDKVCTNPYRDLTPTECFTHNSQHRPPAYTAQAHCTFRTHCAFSGHPCGLCPVSLVSER